MKGSLIEAGAGCGKTYTIVSRYVRALGYDPDTGKAIPGNSLLPRHIWLLTFTEDAASEMLERILAKLDSLGLSSLKQDVLENSVIGTIHSLCYRLLRPLLPQVGYEAGSKIVSGPLAQTLRGRHLMNALSRFEEREELFGFFDSPQVIQLGLALWNENVDTHGEEIKKMFDRMNDDLGQRLKYCENEVSASVSFYASQPKVKLGWLEEAQRAFTQDNEEERRQQLMDLDFRGGSKILREDKAELYRTLQNLKKFYRDSLDVIFNPDFHQKELRALELLKKYLQFSQAGVPKLLDFDALEKELLKLIQQQTVFPAPRLMILDEAQDTSRTQFSILRQLSNAETEFLVVGDPKQSIYGFRGADVKVFSEFKDQLSLEQLSTSRRSDATLLPYQNAFQRALFNQVKSDYDPAPQDLAAWDKLANDRPVLNEKTPTKIFWSHDLESSFENIFKDFEQRKQSSPTPTTHAVLFFRWKDIFQFAEICRSRSIPFVVNGEGVLESHHLTPLFTLFLKSLLDPELKDFDFALDRFPPVERPTPLDPAAKTLLSQSPPQEIFSRFCQEIFPDRWSLGTLWIASMERFLRDFEDNRVRFDTQLEDLLRIIESGRELGVKLPELDFSRLPADTLILSTLHSSKGLEYDFVYLPELPKQNHLFGSHIVDDEWGLTNSQRIRFGNQKIPTFQSLVPRNKKAWKDFSERKRLLYVAITRAKRGLSLFPLLAGGEKKKEPSGLELLGLVSPPRNNLSFWIDATRGELEDLSIFDEVLPETSVVSDDGVLGQEVWNWPRAESTQNYQVYQPRMVGVSTYLNDGKEKSGPFFFHSGDLKYQDLGNDFHRVMEVWNGNLSALPQLLNAFREDHQPFLLEGATKLRALPELQGYFTDLQDSPEKIYREWAIQKLEQGFSLRGVCDALWMPTPQQAVVIDWKGSHSLGTLQGEERRHKIRQQLQIYARSLQQCFTEVRFMALGIEFGVSETQVGMVLDETLT